MNDVPDTEPRPAPDDEPQDEEPVSPLVRTLSHIETAPTLAAKSEALLALPPDARHQALGALPAPLVAALIEGDPERNTALIANLPAAKFNQIVGLGTPEQGRRWLERAVGSGSLAGAILPSLLTANDLASMLLTDRDVRRALPKLLNFERAERWRQLLTTNEYHRNIDELLMADTEELLAKAPFKNKEARAVLQSLLDFVPELYLETVQTALERAKYAEDRPEEFEDITATPFGLPEMVADMTANGNGHAAHLDGDTAPAEVRSPLADLLPEGGDPVFALVTSGLSPARKAQLEDQLKTLLRQEIVATASFAQADMERAAGRVLFYLRAGIESLGDTLGDATRALETRNLNEISALGAREAEGYRQRALGLAGLRDWLDSRQRQFLDAMKQPEAGIHPETREPVLWLAARPKQERPEWNPVPLSEVAQRLDDIKAWGALARAAFGSADRVHALFVTAKARTFDEALRRTVVALALYRRWEPELVRPVEDYATFRRQYGTGKKNGIDQARQIVLDALDATPDGAWKPSDAKARARTLLLRAVDELETMPLPTAATSRANGHKA